MAEKTNALGMSPLFAQIDPASFEGMLACLGAHTKTYPKHEVIYQEGQAIRQVGVVLWGSIHIQQEDYWGNRTILAQIGPGGLFGEAFACAGVEKLPVGVLATEETGVLFIDYRKIITTCSSACPFHTQLVRNMMEILAEKNVSLTAKIETLTQRTTRGKLLSFLSGQALAAGSNTFTIPFNRQELADYLSVDRSAMSLELSKMQREEILRYDKNKFELL